MISRCCIGSLAKWSCLFSKLGGYKGGGTFWDFQNWEVTELQRFLVLLHKQCKPVDRPDALSWELGNKKVFSIKSYGKLLARVEVSFPYDSVWTPKVLKKGKVKDVELKGHTDSVDQLCWDPKHAELIATASGDKTVRLWDARSGKCSQQVELSGENINITYKPDGTHIAVGNRDDELTILDVRKFKPIHKRKFNYEVVASPAKFTRDEFHTVNTFELPQVPIVTLLPHQVNEIAWNTGGDMFFLTTGNGTVEVLAYPSLQAVNTLNAHTAGCYCIAIDPLGRYFAVGSADSLVSLWSIKEMLCLRTFTKLEWPVRTISFNHTGDYIASASEDLFIDIANVQTGRSVHQIPCRAAMNSVEWNPKQNLLAFAGDDKNKYQADEGVFRIFGFESA
ncbi:hypothetical protein MTR67_033431 [Solanum verrucosum]|uniref:Anaphase-promoting complex subunit 4 WD40 domain-containing protein n=1 Tax=Solanum verrucosum TaxID=315347 RepID=A0AAF0U6F8_SOLVR|nr:hypothetical protein MTR67_033431 [Solanum verrucosum]